MSWTARIAAAGILINAGVSSALLMATGGASSFYLALALGQAVVLVDDLAGGITEASPR